MNDIIKKKFGERMKLIRKSKGYTQEQLAEHILINTRQMARIEAGESFVTSETIYKICVFFKISPKSLFDFDIDDIKVQNDALENITEKLFAISSDSKKIDFVNIAIDALTDKSVLEQLKFIIKGIELTM